MRYTNVFCGRYTLATGTRVIAWFNIVLYVINIVFNILAVDIVESYKENVDEDIDYNRDQLLIFHYICLGFGVVTVLSSAIFLLKMSESEDFMQFMVKWNVIRCLFVFGAIIYVCAEMDHILTVTLSSLLLIIDLCASTYFTGVMSSYIKQLEDPSGQVYTSHEKSNRGPSVCLVSLKKTSQTENKIEYVNEVSNSSSQLPEQGNTAIPDETTGIVNVAVDEEGKKDVTEEKNNDTASTVNTAQPQNSSASTANDEDGEKTNEPAPQSSLKGIPREENTITESRGKLDSNNTHEKDDSELEEKITSPDKETTSPDSNEPYSNTDNGTRDVINNEKSSINIPADPGTQVKSEKREIQKPENKIDSETQENERNETEDSEKSSEVKGIENPAVDVSEVEPPSVVVIPASPDQEAEIKVDIK